MAADVPLLIAEASFRSCDDNPPHLHLTGADCGSVADRMGARKLVLTHIPPWHSADVALERGHRGVRRRHRAGQAGRGLRALTPTLVGPP